MQHKPNDKALEIFCEVLDKYKVRNHISVGHGYSMIARDVIEKLDQYFYQKYSSTGKKKLAISFTYRTLSREPNKGFAITVDAENWGLLFRALRYRIMRPEILDRAVACFNNGQPREAFMFNSMFWLEKELILKFSGEDYIFDVNYIEIFE